MAGTSFGAPDDRRICTNLSRINPQRIPQGVGTSLEPCYTLFRCATNSGVLWGPSWNQPDRFARGLFVPTGQAAKPRLARGKVRPRAQQPWDWAVGAFSRRLFAGKWLLLGIGCGGRRPFAAGGFAPRIRPVHRGNAGGASEASSSIRVQASWRRGRPLRSSWCRPAPCECHRDKAVPCLAIRRFDRGAG